MEHPDTLVWIVEDNDHFREAVQDILRDADGMACDLAATSCETALAALAVGRVPDVVLMDLGLPGIGGVEGIRKIRETSPESRVVVLTIHEADESVFEALCAGASGYLVKPSSGRQIIQAVQDARDGGAPMNAFVASRVLDVFTRYVRPRGEYDLTDREREILQFLVEDRAQHEIAEALFLSPHTVDTHLRNIYAKLHVHSRTSAVAKALRERLL